MAKTTTGYLIKRGAKWYCRYRFNGKDCWHSLNQTDKDLAKIAMTKYLDEIGVTAKTMAARLDTLQRTVEKTAEQIATAEEAQRPRLAIAEAWHAFKSSGKRRQCGEITLVDYGQRWQAFARWVKGKCEAMEEVTPSVAEAFAASLDNVGLSNNRRNKIVQTCRYVFNVLSDQCGNMANPFGSTSTAGITNKPQRAVGRRPLSEAEVMTVCQAATGELRTLLAIGVYTGLRLHDAACLQWEYVNLELRRLVVTPHKTASRSGKTIVIPMHPTLQAILEEAPRANRRGPVLPDMAATYQRSPTTITNRIRHHLEACDIVTSSTGLENADRQAVGKDRKSKAKRTGRGHARAIVSFHSLRHTFVTLAAKAGIPLPIVQEICGHGSPEIQRAYMHMGEDETRRAVLAMPDISAPAEVKALPSATNVPVIDNERLIRVRAWLEETRLSKAIRADLEAILATVDERK